MAVKWLLLLFGSTRMWHMDRIKTACSRLAYSVSQ